MFAVHLTPKGASYSAEVEPFLSAQGLPIADLAVSPADGALYFVVGGRGTQSGLYRVTYTGRESTAPMAGRPLDRRTASLRRLRLELEAFHGGQNPKAIARVWPALAHEDRAIRGAARAALEWQPVSEWRERALEERRPRIALQALLALARSTDKDPTVQPALLKALQRFNFTQLGADEQGWYLRILTVSASRHGMYPAEAAANLLARLEPALPAADSRVNEELVALFAALKSQAFIPRALDLLERCRTQEEEVLYTQALVKAASSPAWTPELRARFFNLAVARIPYWKGGYSVRPVREGRLNAVIALLTPDQRRQYADRIAAAQKPAAVLPASPRNFVRHWSLDDFTPALEAGLKQKRNLENGRSLFTVTGCITCHHFRGEGGMAGPDLSSAGGRYSARDLLDNILNPGKVINEQYALTTFRMKDGSEIVGRTVNRAGETMMVATNPIDPGGSEVRFNLRDLMETSRSTVSIMPEGLLDTLTESDLLDLLAYLTQPVATGPTR